MICHHLLDEALPEVLLRVHQPRLLHLVADGVADVVAVLLGEELGDVPGVFVWHDV